ncbi:MAG: RNA 2',3'-cyclic phosphodiesterase, partial [Christensenellaceae bacterium]|nr:RNA 2',3'-cyclic phosphodiesterase [Christensenellaceae bacterium]
MREDKPLLALQRNLSDRLSTAGFALESRKFSPHITLGREVSTRVEPWWIETFGEMVNSIELMKSERIGGKLT